MSIAATCRAIGLAVVVQDAIASKQLRYVWHRSADGHRPATMGSHISATAVVLLLQLGSGEAGRECCTANRKAAIVKFREKRKARNFEKKVRYESRRRLAEARPRVRGQFVRADQVAAHLSEAAEMLAA